jgi:HlyD family secretion protein
MKNFLSGSFSKVRKFAISHKILSAFGLIVVLGGGYYIHAKAASGSAETRYVLTTVQKGTIISSLSGSGQVSTTNKVDVKAKVSGEITWVAVQPGQAVKAGQALAAIDSKDAKAAVAQAEASLAQAQLQYQKDQVSAPIDYQKTLDDLESAKEDLASTFNDTFNSLSDTYLDLPSIMTDTQNALYGYDLASGASMWNIDYITGIFNSREDARQTVAALSQSAVSDYKTARSEYDASLLSYKTISRTSSQDDIEKILDQSIDTVTDIAQALQSELNLFSGLSDLASTYNMKVPSAVTTIQTNIRSDLSSVNASLSKLISQKKAITSAKQAITNGQNTITLLKVGNESGTNPISLQMEKNSLDKQIQDLADLKADLAEYTIVAPFAGTVSAVTAKVGDDAGTIATIMTNQQVAQLSLNEVDAAKIKPGQKATLTFDAIDGLSLTGTVSSIDPVGTVSQGVVSYTAQIAFDTQDDRVKPGMTVNATVQSDVHQDVLYVPTTAVKTANGQSYVLAFQTPLAETGGTGGVASAIAPMQIPVTVGISDDTDIEILSGLAEGQQVVSRTITGTAAATGATGARTTTGAAGGARGGFGGGAQVIRF